MLSYQGDDTAIEPSHAGPPPDSSVCLTQGPPRRAAPAERPQPPRTATREALHAVLQVQYLQETLSVSPHHSSDKNITGKQHTSPPAPIAHEMPIRISGTPLSPGAVLALKTIGAAGIDDVAIASFSAACCIEGETVVNAGWKGKTTAGRRRWRTSQAPGPAAGTRRSTSCWRMRFDLTCSISKVQARTGSYNIW
jgi:hypothetical protein